MKVLQATVKFSANKVFSGKYGDRQNIVLILPSDEEVTVWFDANHPQYSNLTRGEVVTVIQNRDKFTVAFPDDEEPTTPEATPAAIATSPEQEQPYSEIEGLVTASDRKRGDIFRELCKEALVLRSCHIQVQQLFTNAETGEVLISEETIQKYATTLFLNLKRYW